MKVRSIVTGVVLGAFTASVFVGRALGFWKGSDGQVEIRRIDWTPPVTSIPAGYLNSAKLLLGNGLADPRGGTFSKVRINLGDAAWARATPQDAYGWVLTGGKNVVAVDGLEYPVLENLGPVDVDRSLFSSSQGRRFGGQPYNVVAVTIATPSLLLMTGQTDLAEKAFGEFKNRQTSDLRFQLYNHLRQRYQMMAAENLIERKDKEGLGWSEGLLKVATVQKDENVTAEFPDEAQPDSALAKASEVYKDFRRRVDHPKQEPFDLKVLERLAKPARISALIDALDTVGVQQTGQPGGIDFVMDPIVKSLCDLGQDTVPALIETIEKDDRLTRSVSFGRDFFPERSIHSVRDAAWSVITNVWPSSRPLLKGSPAATAAVLRDAWSRSATLTEPERWLNVLADDNAGSDAWLAAAQFLVKPSDQRQQGMWTRVSRQNNAPMTGESLRAKDGPRVTELLKNRTLQVSTVKEKNSALDLYELSKAFRLGHCLAKWDLAASRDTLKSLCTESLGVSGQWSNSPEYIRDTMAPPYGVIVADRVKAGDKSALADLLPLMKVSQLRIASSAEFYRVLWTSLDDPDVQEFSHRLMQPIVDDFAAPDLKVALRTAQIAWQLMRTPMWLVPTFRRTLLIGLDQHAVAGSAWIDNRGDNKFVSYAFKNFGSGGFGIQPRTTIPKTRGKVTVTVGDFVAQTIAQTEGAPDFCMAWTPEEREAAKTQLKAWLTDESLDWEKLVESLHYWDANSS